MMEFKEEVLALAELSKETGPNERLDIPARAIRETFTGGILLLKDRFPNRGVRDLMSLYMDLLEGHVVSVGLGPSGSTISFVVFSEKDSPDEKKGAVLLPPNWAEDFPKKPIFQLGSLVFIASQVVDFYNDRVTDDSCCLAEAWEAEYLFEIPALIPDWIPLSYQKVIMRDHPKGIESESVQHLRYTSKPFLTSRFIGSA